jgi:hypothetical protein
MGGEALQALRYVMWNLLCFAPAFNASKSGYGVP